MSCELPPDAGPSDIGRTLEMLHAQQSQMHGLLATLDSRSRDVDATLVEAVQRAFMEAAGSRAADTLNQVHRATGIHFARWTFAIVSACALLPTALSWMLMPSRSQLAQARQSADQLSAQVALLSREGGRIDLRHCGAANRLCVRVERKSPFYGDEADYMVLKGY